MGCFSSQCYQWISDFAYYHRDVREYYLYAMQVMQAMGKLTAKNLKLDVELYQPKKLYKETRDKWLSTSIDK